jgi:hypothetical protein
MVSCWLSRRLRDSLRQCAANRHEMASYPCKYHQVPYRVGETPSSRQPTGRFGTEQRQQLGADPWQGESTDHTEQGLAADATVAHAAIVQSNGVSNRRLALLILQTERGRKWC